LADSLSMAHLAFGNPGRSIRAGRALQGLRTVSRLAGAGRSSRHGGHRKKSRHHKAQRTHASRGVRLSNEFLKTFILLELAKGAMKS
jgi:hypothetical protein